VVTGEDCLEELSDATFYHNSRAFLWTANRALPGAMARGKTFDNFAVEETSVESKVGCSNSIASFPMKLDSQFK